jgi:hypothetical protein
MRAVALLGVLHAWREEILEIAAINSHEAAVVWLDARVARRLNGASNGTEEVTLGCDQPDAAPAYVDDSDGDALQTQRYEYAGDIERGVLARGQMCCKKNIPTDKTSGTPTCTAYTQALNTGQTGPPYSDFCRAVESPSLHQQLVSGMDGPKSDEELAIYACNLLKCYGAQVGMEKNANCKRCITAICHHMYASIEQILEEADPPIQFRCDGRADVCSRGAYMLGLSLVLLFLS